MKRILQSLLVVLILAGLASCDRKKVYESYRELHPKGWNKDSLAVFNVQLTDTTNIHNLYINIRNKGTYPYSNLYLFLTVGSPDGTSLTDTIEVTLADPSGKWKGSGIGSLFDNQILYKSGVFFPHSGNYSFTLKQGMRDNLLEGIRDIGIRIERAN